MYCILTIVRYPKYMGWVGFLSMALFRLPLWLNKNISFWKLLGCGKNGTFDKTPDWRQWGILAVVPKHTAGELQPASTTNPAAVINQLSPFIAKYFSLFRCEIFTLLLQPIEGHGSWDGREIFGSLPKQTAHEGLIAVLTRATIRLNKLNAFWKNVPGAASAMNTAEGFITSVGIGEVPWIKQATFSIWSSKENMKQYAYKMQHHADVIRKTRRENWYSEEMFVRFKPLAVYGTIRGKNPLNGWLADSTAE